MAIQGFNKNFYLNAKLAQLQANSETAADWAGKDVAFLEARFNAVGLTAEAHYEQYGFQEGLAPNAFFNPDEYIRAKATAMFNDANNAYLTIDAAAQDFVNLWGGNVYNHYLQFGEAEGVNPSNSFDVSGYYEAKLAQLQAAGNTEITTAAQVKAAFDAAGISALEHFITYGQGEGITAPAVPAEEQVSVETSVPGQTFSLTTGQDNPTATSDDDTFIAVVDGTAAGTTFTLGDVINGLGGTDTLSIVSDQATVNLARATISNVEIADINMDAVGAPGNAGIAENAGTVNLNSVAYQSATIEGVTGDDATGGFLDTLTVNNANLATRVVLEDITNVASTVNFSGATGTADSATVEVAGSTDDATNQQHNNLTVANVETLNLEFSTAANDLNVVTAAAAKTVNVKVGENANTTLQGAASLTAATALSIVANGDLTLAATANLADEAAITVSGAGDVDLSTLDTSTGDGNTLDASELTGDLTVTGSAGTASITGGSGGDDITSGANTTAVAAGAGDDTVRLAGLDYSAAAAATVAGGEGRDTLNMTDATVLDADYLAKVTGFEVLDAAGSTTQNYDVDGLGFEELTVSGAVTTSVTFSNITDEDLTITGNTTGEVIYNLKDVSGNSDELTVTIAGAYSNSGTPNDLTDDANDISAGSITNTQAVETINLVSNTAEGNVAGVDNDITMLDTNATTVNISGNHALTITDFEDGGAVNATIDTINASESAGLIMGGAVSTAGVSITGSSNADTILVGTSDGAGTGTATGSTINAGMGGDVINLIADGAVTGAVDTLIVDAGDSKIGFVDSNDDQAYTDTADEETFDVVTGFTSTEDTIDLGSFGFTGQSASALAGASLAAGAATDLVNGTTTDIANFFVDTGVQRGVAVVENYDASAIGGAAGSTLVFIDSDGDGSLNAANDDMIVLSGTASVALSDFGF